MKPRRERLGQRTLPCNFSEKKRIKGVLMCLEVFLEEKYREKRERKIPRKWSSYPRWCSWRCLDVFDVFLFLFLFLCKIRGLGVFIGQNWPFSFRQTLYVFQVRLAATVCVPGQVGGHCICTGSGSVEVSSFIFFQLFSLDFGRVFEDLFEIGLSWSLCL